jgi:hypothetical protein
MRYQLSFCEIEQLSDNIFEVTTAEGAIIDDKCAKEANDFWLNLRTEQFSILVNSENSFSFSFTGSIEIAANPLRRKTAILLSNKKTKADVEMTLDLKRTKNPLEESRCFHDRAEAIEWLKTV